MQLPRSLLMLRSFGGSTFCPAPKTLKLNTTGLFPKPKPANATAPKPNGIRKKVLHMSDIHLDPRYGAGTLIPLPVTTNFAKQV